MSTTDTPNGHGSGTTQQSSRSRKAYARRACTHCRGQKVRCLPGPDDSGTCLRCHRMREECVFTESKRPQKRRLLNNRVRQLEQRIEDLTSLLGTSVENSPGALPSAPSSNLRHSSTENELASEEPRNGLGTSIKVHSSQSGPGEIDPIKGKLLSVDEGDSLVSKFMGMAHKCPFVVLPQDVTLASLRKESPFLLYSIFIASASSNQTLQSQLTRQYLLHLSTQVLIEGYKSVDVLQSIVVYLCWYHFAHKPGSYGCNRTSALAVSVAYDLNIHRPPLRRPQQQMSLETLSDIHTPESQHSEFWPPHVRRAFVGCYVTSSIYSILLRKPPLMPYMDYLSISAESLAKEARVPTDKALPAQLELCRCVELIGETFGYWKSQPEIIWHEEILKVYISSFSGRIEGWTAACAKECRQEIQLDTEILHAFLREVALYCIPKNATSSLARTKIMVDCLSHTKTYLEGVMKASVESLSLWTALEWAWLNYMVLLMMKMSTSIHNEFWNIKMARAIIKPEDHLDALLNQTRQLKGKIDNIWYRIMTSKWEVYKSQYLKTLQAMTAEEASEEMRTQQQTSPAATASIAYAPAPISAPPQPPQTVATSEANNLSWIPNRTPVLPFASSNMPPTRLETPPHPIGLSQAGLSWQGSSTSTVLNNTVPLPPFNFDFPALFEEDLFGDHNAFMNFPGFDT